MKRILPLLAVLAVSAGCHTITIELPGGGKGSVKSVGRRSSFEELSLTPSGTLKVKGYNNDEVTGLGMAIGALKDLAGKTAAGGVVP